MRAFKVVLNKKGVVFVSVLVISMLMVLIGVSASNMLLQDVHMIRRLENSTKAQYAAEAGISDALATLVQNGFVAKDTMFPLADTIGEGSYTVSVTESGERVLLTSVGTVNSASKTVAVEVKDAVPNALYYMLCGGNNVKFRAFFLGLADINGDIHANNDITLRAQAIALIDIGPCPAGDCDGNVSAGDDISKSTGFLGFINIAGTETEDAGMVSFPEFDYDYYKTLAQDSSDYYSSNTTIGSTSTTTNLSPGNGVVYVDGMLTLRGTINLTGGIVAEKIEVRGQLNQTKDTSHNTNVIIAKGGGSPGDIKIFNELATEEAVVYATRDFDVVAAFSVVNVTGALIAGRNIRVWDAASFVTYNHYILTPGGLSGDDSDDTISIVAWTR
ncbi:MAG: pilus assembly PilX N-terminal domain-containing protein [Candidatus Omnitrophica bacterium]|nr:pilus assembly PilX N-terminal domain-containing protein [Candidatus Omnitrophota bacterium]